VPLALAGACALGLAVLAGCSSASSAGATGTSCGRTRTGVNVPVAIMVARGPARAYPTPQVLRTGDASECHTASAEVVAVLSLPSASSAASTGS
jgi:hypothetical protein